MGNRVGNFDCASSRFRPRRDPSPTLDRPGGLARNKPGLKISRSENSLLTFR